MKERGEKECPFEGKMAWLQKGTRLPKHNFLLLSEVKDMESSLIGLFCFYKYRNEGGFVPQNAQLQHICG